MWHSSWSDAVWLMFMITSAVWAALDGWACSSLIIGFCAGNQMQICLAGIWWKHVRSLYSVDREAAISVFEDQASA